VEFLIVAVLGILAIAGATAIAPKIGVAAPLLLVLVGIGVSFLPFVPDLTIEPEWILAGVLPPLLYSASVSMPSMEFRREFTAISGLSVLLVVASAVALGFLFAWLIPGLGLPTGIALGAIISPTDAVATSIVKRVGVSPRIVAVLEGESLLNDATALVVLRTAIAATAASVSLWGVLGDFVFAVVVAVIIGYLVGKLNLLVRSRVTDATVNTVISFAVPFVAAIPAEHFGASGLVAAVVAGLVTGRGTIKYLTPQHRLSDAQNWRTIELLLEGAVFLVMGLELSTIVADLHHDGEGIGVGIGLAALALVVVLLVRALYVTPLLGALKRSAKRGERFKPRLEEFQAKVVDTDLATASAAAGRPVRREPTEKDLERFQTRVRRKVADIDYFLAEPLGWREGTVVVWAGMRGVVTLAAAQTLPEDTPSRSLLIFVAFVVAAASLLIQGGSLAWVVKTVKPAQADPEAAVAERAALIGLMMAATQKTVEEHADEKVVGQYRELMKRMEAQSKEENSQNWTGPSRKLRLQIIEAQRQALLAARDDGMYSAGALNYALESLDADQISMEMRGDPSE
jgi:NhaP-type Na+/H+ or K+/H+ antiporter